MKKFHVYIIESPGSKDFYHKIFEGESLEKTLRLSGIESSHRFCVDRENFVQAFRNGMIDYFKKSSLSPIVHISAHGNSDGLGLTNGDIILWDELRELLIPINKVLDGTLLVSMSSCEGFNGCKMAMNDDKFPFSAILGPVLKPTWADTNIGFSTFYHLFAREEVIETCISAMNKASGNSFGMQTAKQARELFVAEYNKITSGYSVNLNKPLAVSTMSSEIKNVKNKKSVEEKQN
ncbi:MAG TPA: hypothetical protein VLG12_04600 [Candidatus Saccharimonadales bacterium]|nr:hypothetical protein [Candidatus Saccharimonadales bacterium]